MKIARVIIHQATIPFNPMGNRWIRCKMANLSGTDYFFINVVKTYLGLVRDRTAVHWPLQDMSYGTREFGIRDCNGYYLAFAQA